MTRSSSVASMRRVIAILTPAFNEEQVIGTVLNDLPRRIRGYDVVPVVVDDGSSDRTAEIARQYTPHVVRREKNGGVGVATRDGFSYILGLRSSGMDIVFVVKCDGDKQHNTKSHDKFEETVDLLDQGTLLVAGSRFNPSSEQRGTKLNRAALNGMIARELMSLTGWPITDGRTGFMGLGIDVVEKIVDDMIVERYGVPINIILATWWRIGKEMSGSSGFREVVLPAIYSGEIPDDLKTQYIEETEADMFKRMFDAYGAYYTVLRQLGIETGFYWDTTSHATKAMLEVLTSRMREPASRMKSR